MCQFLVTIFGLAKVSQINLRRQFLSLQMASMDLCIPKPVSKQRVGEIWVTLECLMEKCKCFWPRSFQHPHKTSVGSVLAAVQVEKWGCGSQHFINLT